MAEAFASLLGSGDVEVYSAGSRPSGQVNLNAIKLMREIGYDLNQQESKSLLEVPDVEYDFVATMGCGDECPYVKAKRRVEWDIPDPKNMAPAEFRQVRDLIEVKVKEVLREILE